MHPITRALVTVTLTLGTLAGCGDDADQAATTTDRPSTTAASSVEVSAVDFAFEGLPDELKAGTAITLRNTSAAELHELVALRLPDDELRSIEELVALPNAELEARFTAPPALVAVAPPGEVGFVALGDGTLTEPGRYVVICFIPTGADPQAYLDALAANPGQPPQIDGGPPHHTAGMYTDVIVVA